MCYLRFFYVGVRQNYLCTNKLNLSDNTDTRTWLKLQILPSILLCSHLTSVLIDYIPPRGAQRRPSIFVVSFAYATDRLEIAHRPHDHRRLLCNYNNNRWTCAIRAAFYSPHKQHNIDWLGTRRFHLVRPSDASQASTKVPSSRYLTMLLCIMLKSSQHLVSVALDSVGHARQEDLTWLAKLIGWTRYPTRSQRKRRRVRFTGHLNGEWITRVSE